MARSFFLLNFMLSIYFMLNKKCGVEKYRNKKRHQVNVHGENGLRNLQLSDWTQIRIYIDYDMLDSQELEDDLKDNLKQTMDNTIALFQTLVQVKPLSKPLILKECEDGVSISNLIKTEGVNADLILIPYIDDTAGSDVEASAGPCANDDLTGRPIMGSIGFSNRTDYSRTNAQEYYTIIALHELTHVFVFLDFQGFINPNTIQQLKQSDIIGSVTVNGKTRSIIKTPKVIQAARKHFNCSTLEGVQLEDQGGDGTAGAHWESRTMLSDYMVGQAYVENTLSEITLALFEDSGWYKVNYYTGGLFRFGKNQGCGFLNSNCIKEKTSSDNDKQEAYTDFPNDFCSVRNAQICSPGRLAKGYCYMQKDSNIPKPQRYFLEDQSLGGFQMADYCPVSWSDDQPEIFFPGICAYGDSQYPTALGEVISKQSSCFMSSLTPVNDNSVSEFTGNSFPICYKYTCNQSTRSYKVSINGRDL
jgi:leishmanolysin